MVQSKGKDAPDRRFLATGVEVCEQNLERSRKIAVTSITEGRESA